MFVKEIEVTKDMLRASTSSLKEVVEETTPDQRIADLRTKQMMKQTQIRDLDLLKTLIKSQ